MIPIGTSVEVREIPGAVVGLIIANVAVFLVQASLPPDLAEQFIYHNGLVPARYTQPGLVGKFGLDAGNFFPFLTNSFMHAGLAHLIFNMWTLWLLGRTLEQRLGTLKFVLFYLVCGLVASLAHFAFNFYSPLPALGASGAIAGMLGGYTLLYPRARVVLVTPVLFFPAVYRLPFMVYTTIWLIFQLVPGIAELFSRQHTGGIAWWAHIGGLVAGALLAGYMGKPRRQPREIGPRRAVIQATDTNRPWIMKAGRGRRRRLETRLSLPRKGKLPALLQPRQSSDSPRARRASVPSSGKPRARGAVTTAPEGRQRDRPDEGVRKARSTVPQAGQRPVIPQAARQANVDAGQTEILLLSCMDSRLIDHIARYMNRRYLTDSYDHFILAGASLGAQTDRFPEWGQTFWQHLDASVTLHRISKVMVIDHRDCAAYKRILGKDFATDRADETDAHTRQMVGLRTAIHAKYPTLKIELLLMELDGKVEKIV